MSCLCSQMVGLTPMSEFFGSDVLCMSGPAGGVVGHAVTDYTTCGAGV